MAQDQAGPAGQDPQAGGALPERLRAGLRRVARKTMRRLGRAVAVVALVAWAVGSVVSLILQDPDLFQRFGAIGCAAAVLFFSDRLTAVELARQRSVEKLLHEYGIELEAMKQGTDPRDLPAQGYVIDFLTEERNFGKLRASADRLGMLNIALLTLATLQWGFGDLYLSAHLPELPR